MPPIVGTPTDWLSLLQHAIRDIFCCWTLDVNNVTSSSSNENNLFTLVHTQRAATYLEQVIQQNNQDLDISRLAIDEHKVKAAEALAAIARMEANLKVAQDRLN